MPLDHPTPGPGASGEFQSSALPWVTSSVANSGETLRIDLPFVSRFITIYNYGLGSQFIRVGFTKNGVEANPPNNAAYLRVPGSGSIGPLEMRVPSVYIRPDGSYSPPFSLAIGLTTVPARFMPALTGSDGWQGVG